MAYRHVHWQTRCPGYRPYIKQITSRVAEAIDAGSRVMVQSLLPPAASAWQTVDFPSAATAPSCSRALAQPERRGCGRPDVQMAEVDQVPHARQMVQAGDRAERRYHDPAEPFKPVTPSPSLPNVPAFTAFSDTNSLSSALLLSFEVSPHLYTWRSPSRDIVTATS